MESIVLRRPPTDPYGHVVVTVGPAGAGKSRFTRDMEQFFSRHGLSVIGISIGDIYRALAILGTQLRQSAGPHTIFLPHTIVQAAKGLLGQPAATPLTLETGWPCLGGVALTKEQLRDPSIEMYASQLGAEPVIYAYVLELVQHELEIVWLMGGYGFVDGRGLFANLPWALKLSFTVSDHIAGHRSGRSAAEVAARNARDRRSPNSLSAVDAEAAVKADLIVDTDRLSCEEVFVHCLPVVVKQLGLGRQLGWPMRRYLLRVRLRRLITRLGPPTRLANLHPQG